MRKLGKAIIDCDKLGLFQGATAKSEWTKFYCVKRANSISFGDRPVFAFYSD